MFHMSTRKNYVVSHHVNVPRSYIDSFVLYAIAHPLDTVSTRTALGAAISFCALLRVSELTALRWDDLHWSSDLIKVSVRRAKNDQLSEGRDTFISLKDDSPTLTLFHQYRARVPHSEWFLPSISHPSSPITTDCFRKDLSRLCSLSGVERITPHQLRAGGAMESVKSGVPLEAVQRRGRWRSLAGLTPYLEDTVESQGGTLAL